MTDAGKTTEPTTEPAAARPAAPGGAVWAAVAWSVGVLALLIALPLVARHRLPDPLATHWGGREPDGSMSLTAATLFPAAFWAVLVLISVAVRRYSAGQAPGAASAMLAAGGVLLTGAQTSIVHANLDRARWQDAAPMGIEVVLILLATGLAGVLALLAGRRYGGRPERHPAAGAPALEVPPGEQVVWLSQAANPWLQLIAAVLGLLTVAGVLVTSSGVVDLDWVLVLPLAVGALAILGCSSVRARVTERGLTVGFGPFGWPARRWSPAELDSARAERRTAAQSGGWGYRINGLGTTVMVRPGVCLVVRTRRGTDFAVSVDDAERGAALLNALIARTRQPTG
ncbi:DUF1648 domain-containing protein [Kitasatospora sp. NPDC057512]|uniref:DUF1648 domain-containing protein n=1 Tax=Kitasatospora sp. NPDC057512 TaxID=3346154 RepID=UPI0036A3AB2C